MRSLGGSSPVEEPLWVGVDVFRSLTFVYALVTVSQGFGHYRRPWLAVVVLLVMAAWTLASWFRRGPRRAATVVADLVLSCVTAASTVLVDTPERLAAGAPTVPTVWAATAVLSWAVWRGWAGGVAAALCLGTVDMLTAGRVGGNTLHNNVLLLLLGGLIGFCADLFRSSHRALRHALAVEAATAERERLARDIHDSVLQVLAFVQRRGGEIGGEAVELGRLAGEQERLLRNLVSTRPDTGQAGEAGVGADDLVDLRSVLALLDRDQVSLVAPADPVRLPRRLADGLAAAVTAAVDNVGRHAGQDARAWVLVEDEGDHVAVTVRDDGVGIAAGRLEAAERDGRLGVAQSVRGRLEDLGGTCSIRSVVGEGTEVSMRLPRRVKV